MINHQMSVGTRGTLFQDKGHGSKNATQSWMVAVICLKNSQFELCIFLNLDFLWPVEFEFKIIA